jgi:DNA-binding Lrp family transcriptional regulator
MSADSDTGAGDPGLTPTEHAPVGSTTVDATDKPVTKLWASLLDEERIQKALIDAVQELARERTMDELYTELDERDVPQHLHTAIAGIWKGDQSSAWELVARARELADSHMSNDFAGVDDVLGAAALFDALDGETTVSIRLDREFRNRDRGQREDILALVETLADGFDVRLAMGRETRVWLANSHPDDLAGVAEWRDTRQCVGPLDDVVDAALAELDPDGRAVRVLEHLAREPSETLTYSTLDAQMTVKRSWIRQLVINLEELGLVNRFGPQGDRRAELLQTGTDALDALAAEKGKQQTLTESVGATGKSCEQAVVSEQGRETPSPSDGSGTADPPAFRTSYFHPTHRFAVSATAADGGIALYEQPSTASESVLESRTKYVEYDRSNDEAVVSVRASSALAYITSLSTALASPQLLDKIPNERFEDVDEAGWKLRGMRCIGALSDEALEDVDELRKGYKKWGRTVAELTTKMQNGECDDRARFRSEIMLSAHGLAGALAHLYDAMGIDVVREVRVPNRMNRGTLEEIAQTIAISSGIQSRYKGYASYRRLFETDAGAPNLSPTVDASDPAASLIGGFIIRGGDVERLRGPLLEWIEAPGERQEDADEFVVRVPFREVGRSEYSEAVGRTLAWKNLRPSDDLVSVMHALAPSPFAACDALRGTLEKESTPDDLRPDEVRVALSTLDAQELLPDLAPSVGKIVQVLLQADARLSASELAEAADVSTRTLRNHRDRLEALGLIDIDSVGWRLNLSFATTEERRAPVMPATVDGTFVEAVDALLLEALPPDRYADPDDPVAGVVFWPVDPWGLVDSSRSISPWAALAGRLAGAERSDEEIETAVEMGPEIEQAPLSEAPSTAEV